MFPSRSHVFFREMQPAVDSWLEENPGRAAQLTPDEMEELYSLFGVGGSLTNEGVGYYVGLIERKRALREKIEVVINTEFLDELEPIIERMYREAQPYADRR